jgi:O-antigen ligase
MLLPIVSDILLRNKISFSERLSQRLVLADLAGRAFSQNPVFGFGLNNFIPGGRQLEEAGGLSWILQPVHNIPILILAEGGILGFVIFAWPVFRSIELVRTRPIFFGQIFVFVILTSLIDHYWFTLQQNQLLLAVLTGLLLRQNQKDFLLN